MSTTALFSGMGLETPAGWRPLFVESPEYQGNVIPNHHHHRKVRVANEGRRVVAPSCPRSTARLQRSPVGRVSRFVAGRASCSVDDQVGDATCGQEVG